MLWSFCVGACDSPSLWLDIFIYVRENFVLGPRCNYCSALLHFEQCTKHILLHRSKGIKNKWFFEPQCLRERIMNTEHAISEILYITAECNGIFMVICGFNFDLGIRLLCRRGKQAISTLMSSSSSWFYQFVTLHSSLMHFILLRFLTITEDYATIGNCFVKLIELLIRLSLKGCSSFSGWMDRIPSVLETSGLRKTKDTRKIASGKCNEGNNGHAHSFS